MKLNITIEVRDREQVQALVDHLEHKMELHVIDWSVLTDTTNMYKEDTFFKSISKTYYKARQVRNDYINKHNGKYLK